MVKFMKKRRYLKETRSRSSVNLRVIPIGIL